MINTDKRPTKSLPAICNACAVLARKTAEKSHYCRTGNSHLPNSQDATVGNTSMIALRVEKMAIGNGSSPPSVRLSLAGLPET
jgi:hypothetical protein